MQCVLYSRMPILRDQNGYDEHLRYRATLENTRARATFLRIMRKSCRGRTIAAMSIFDLVQRYEREAEGNYSRLGSSRERTERPLMGNIIEASWTHNDTLRTERDCTRQSQAPAQTINSREQRASVWNEEPNLA